MVTKPDCLPKGTVLNSGTARYTIIEVVGSGGFGITYKASVPLKIRHIATRATVAIKELFIADDCTRDVSGPSSMTVSTSGSGVQRFRNAMSDFLSEAKRLQSLSDRNPNIVNVNEVFEANGTAYYVMEYLNGPSLRDYVKSRGQLSEEETLDIILPIVRAVKFLHSQRIMHLDIKPANIVMVQDEEEEGLRPVLIDFGQSKHYGSDGKATYTVATAGISEGYAPVEQYAGIKTFSPEADIYALAATILFCLTGKRPPRSVEMTPHAIEQTLPAGISSNLRSALHSALEMNPESRTHSAQALLASLSDYTTPITPPESDTDNDCGDYEPDNNGATDTPGTNAPTSDRNNGGQTPPPDSGEPDKSASRSFPRSFLVIIGIVIAVITATLLLDPFTHAPTPGETGPDSTGIDSIDIDSIDNDSIDSIDSISKASQPFTHCAIIVADSIPIYKEASASSPRLITAWNKDYDIFEYKWISKYDSLKTDPEGWDDSYVDAQAGWDPMPILETKQHSGFIKIGLSVSNIFDTSLETGHGWIVKNATRQIPVEPIDTAYLKRYTVHRKHHADAIVNSYYGPEGWDTRILLVGEKKGDVIVFDKGYLYSFLANSNAHTPKRGLQFKKIREGDFEVDHPLFGSNLWNYKVPVLSIVSDEDFQNHFTFSNMSEQDLKLLLEKCTPLKYPYYAYQVNGIIYHISTGPIIKDNDQ